MFIWCQFSDFGSWFLGLFVDCGEEGTLGYRYVWTEVTHFMGDERRRRKMKGRKETDKGEGRKHERGGRGEEERKKERGK